MASNILLLTATIQPPAGVPLLARTNSAARLDDYAKSLRFYLTLLGKCFDAIVFAENSAYNLSVLRELARAAQVDNRVEFISCFGLDIPPSYARAYGEFKLVDHTVANSSFLGRDDGQIVWKCTGKYLVRNLDLIVRERPRVCDVYCHMRKY